LKRASKSESGAKPFEQSSAHFPYFQEFELRFLMTTYIQHSQILREQKEILKLAGRAHGNVEKLAKFGAPSASAPLSNVCGDGGSRAANLTASAELLFCGQVTRDFVSSKRQAMTAPLNTNNCRLHREGSHAD